MDIKTASAIHRLRLVSAPEAVTYLLLLVCSVLKRTTEFNAVPVMGAIHGFLVIVFVLFWALAWYRAKWSLTTAAWYFVLSLLPFGGFHLERRLKRDSEDAVIASRVRKEGVVGA